MNAVFILITLVISIIAWFLSYFICKKLYFITDIVIMIIFLLIMTFYSKSKALSSPAGLYPSYTFWRGVVILVVFIIKKIKKVLPITRDTIDILLMPISVIVNIITPIAFIFYWPWN